MVTLVEDNDHAPQMIHPEEINIFPNTVSSLFAKNELLCLVLCVQQGSSGLAVCGLLVMNEYT